MLKAGLLLVLTIRLLMPGIGEASTLYRCVDEFNHATYTNYRAGNHKCTVMSRDGGQSSGSAPATRSTSTASKKPSPADFPKVASETQKSRDGDRRYILEQELAAEQKHLDEARKILASQVNAQTAVPNVERVQPLRDRVALHERNLDALRREISHLK